MCVRGLTVQRGKNVSDLLAVPGLRATSGGQEFTLAHHSLALT